jgi:alkanesulfonate monooxygenase SsuD/methylene tetrahydromethanopterin reductase-like flavin-dependent oxidoreductase (luciferase family)
MTSPGRAAAAAAFDVAVPSTASPVVEFVSPAAAGRPTPRFWVTFRPIIAKTDAQAWEKAYDYAARAGKSSAGFKAAILDYVDAGASVVSIRGYDTLQDAKDYGTYVLPLVRQEIAHRHATGRRGDLQHQHPGYYSDEFNSLADRAAQKLEVLA